MSLNCSEAFPMDRKIVSKSYLLMICWIFFHLMKLSETNLDYNLGYKKHFCFSLKLFCFKNTIILLLQHQSCRLDFFDLSYDGLANSQSIRMLILFCQEPRKHRKARSSIFSLISSKYFSTKISIKGRT